ncbi:MAG: aspartate aminotransferase family protein [Bacteroidetes bacterium]|nr:MAG: aspartate aminotransferase family protein [Bacteroidota bacterium]
MNLLERESDVFFHTYKRFSLEIERGEGVYLYAKDGSRYLDMFAGLAVNALGYGNEKVVTAIQEQAKKYIHLSNYFLPEPQLTLAELLVKLSGYSKIFFSNSGTEAIEGAMKLARKWGSARNKEEIISFSRAFHGRTFGALSLMDNNKYKEGYEPFLPNCTIVEFNNPDQFRQAVNAQTTAVILECIQGEGGVRPASKPFIEELKALKEQFGFLLIADEIQAGLGRTGKLFAYQHYDLHPDIVVVAKPLGGGLPLGAFLGNETVAEILSPGAHGTTFGGNPVACAAGVATLKEIIEQHLMENAKTIGQLFKSELERLQREFPSIIRELRGEGLMLGIEIDREGEQIVTAMREQRILINCTDKTVLRFLPPLILQETHVRETVAALRSIFSTLPQG